MQVKLRVLRGSSAGKEIRIPGPIFRIGRDEECHLRPKSDAISRRHCEIEINDDEDRVLIRDLGSKNGTSVNDERVEGETELKLGNLLRVGRLEFEVVIEHGLGGAKKPKINDVKEAAARVSAASDDDSTAEDADISGWLQEGDDSEKSRRVADPETRQFRLDETDRVALAEAGEEARNGDESQESSSESADGEKSAEMQRPPKQKPKKLPTKPVVKADSSRDAAADMLKKFFNRT